jgi:hypothetical protein
MQPANTSRPAGPCGEKPDQIERRASLLKRLGRTDEAGVLTDRLEAMGFRHTV